LTAKAAQQKQAAAPAGTESTPTAGTPAASVGSANVATLAQAGTAR